MTGGPEIPPGDGREWLYSALFIHPACKRSLLETNQTGCRSRGNAPGMLLGAGEMPTTIHTRTCPQEGSTVAARLTSKQTGKKTAKLWGTLGSRVRRSRKDLDNGGPFWPLPFCRSPSPTVETSVLIGCFFF
ncbi:hypothetical protein HJG60_008145 [Phyllostomus discolor]|uniref:Uncharacterized protein n=1 Tax=Phyllostomus discolor TaxID=89673 RepID=A0A833Z920_9CHIR|nr:hypothetical protein HJG60_008145 [Phyllostomus discolor]